MRICEYVEKRKEILREVKWMKENVKQKIQAIEIKLVLEYIMRLKFEICFVGWLWGIKECNGCASLENKKIKEWLY